MSKILEKVVLHQLLAHLPENNLCNPFQLAYCTGHSTETTLLPVVKQLVKRYGRRQNLCFTLTGSFSCIWYYRSPDSLLYCLETAFGINSTALQWFRSYLLDRNQCAVANNSASSSSPLMFGVLQGSVLGPVLFVLYTTPLSDTANHSVNHQLFANTQLQKSTPPNDVWSHTHDLASFTDNIKAWRCNNQVKLTEDKTEAVLFSTPSLSPCHCLPSWIMVGTHEIVFSRQSQELYPWL